MQIVRFLSSVKLTLFLLLFIATIAIFGTIGKPELGRYDLFYKSIWFRSALALLALNLSVCTIKTIRRQLKRSVQIHERISKAIENGLLLQGIAGSGIEQLESIARKTGFSVNTKDNTIIASKGAWGRWGSTIVHISILSIMFGALLGGAGFVGTLNTYIGDQSDFYFDWDTQKDKPLGFTFRLDKSELIYYPVELKFEAIDPTTGKSLQQYQAKEGESVHLPIKDLRARIVKFDPEEKQFVLSIYRRGEYLDEYFIYAGGERFGAMENPGVRLVPLESKDRILKQYHSEVTILEKGNVVKTGIIEINHPITYKGVSIYQTAYNKDDKGFPFAGFQFSKDPGEPIVWTASITIIIGCLIAFWVKHRSFCIVRKEEDYYLVPLAGFATDAGRKDLADLQDFIERVARIENS